MKQKQELKLKTLPLLQDGQTPKYVIYARKSTDEGSEKQVASIPQQIEACFEYAKKEQIALMPRPEEVEVDPKTIQEIEDDNTNSKARATELKAFYVQYWVVTERYSAKVPFKRTKWRELMDLVQSDKIRGLLGYSPDRFSRNLQEGGEVIQMADNLQVALKFTNFHYDNNAAGQMMLGFWFVFAEHYSKKLSEDVTRGSKKKHLKGRTIGTRKFGYTRDGQDRYIPDPVFHPILQKAFRRKLHENWSDAMIVEEMNASGWDQALQENDGVNRQMTSQKISNRGKNGFNLWSDPFYYGEHVKLFKGKEVKVDLRDLDDEDYDFIPAIEEKDWIELQEVLSARTHASIVKKASLRSKRLEPVKPTPENFIQCSECEHVMSYALPNRKRFQAKMEKEGKELHEVVEPHQIRYRCSNTKCSAKGLEIKWDEAEAKVSKLFSTIKVSELDYQAYLFAKKEDLEAKHIERLDDQKRVNVLLNKAEGDYKAFLKDSSYGAGLSGKKREVWRNEEKGYEIRIEELQERKKELRQDIREEILDQQNFIEMIKSLHKYWEKGDYVQKREILENFCLNIVINPKKQLQINIKPELESMFIQNGGPAWI